MREIRKGGLIVQAEYNKGHKRFIYTSGTIKQSTIVSNICVYARRSESDPYCFNTVDSLSPYL
jgi:hypothetical protein